MRLILIVVCLCAVLVASLFLDRPAPRAEMTTGYVSIETLDVQVARASEDIRIAYALFEGIVTFDPYKFVVVPGVAESWELSGDGLAYTFRIRPDARWSNGDPIVASDFAYSWRLGLMPDTAPPYIEFIQYIKGGRAFTQWCLDELARIKEMPVSEQLGAARRRVELAEKMFDESVGVEVIDERTLRVHMERRTPYFLELLASWPLFPLHPPTIRDATKLNPDSLMLRRDPTWTEAETMVSNGPYILAESRFKRYIRLHASPNYWASDIIGPKTVDLISFGDQATWFNAYATGAVDIVYDAQNLGYGAELIADLRSGERSDVVEHDGFSTYYYCFNTRPTLPGGVKNPFTDPRVRRAFALAVDREAVVNDVTRVGQRPAGSLVPVGSIDGYQSPDGFRHNPKRAQALLAEAGYPNGEGLPTIELSYNSGAGHEDKAQAISRMWTETLGVKMASVAQEWKVYLERRMAGDFMVSRHGWTGDYSDPTTFLDLFRTGNGNNDAGYANPEYDALLDRAADEPDTDKRLEILADAERLLIDKEAALCPIFFYKVIHMQAPHVTGVNTHPRELQFFHLLRIHPVEEPVAASH